MEDFRDLQLFLHVAETLNFGRSSLECHVSPATLTRAIQRLEHDVGHRLMDRGPRGVALTAQGRRFQEYARETLALWRRYRDDEDPPAGLRGRLSIFATVTACHAILPDLLRPFRAAHPQVLLDIQTGDAAAALARLDEGAVDVAVAALPARMPEPMTSRIVARTPLVFIAAEGTDLSSWRDGPFVLPRSGLARDAADRWFRGQRLTPSLAAEPDGHEALLTLVALGCGIGIVPQLVLDARAATLGLMPVPVTPPLDPFTIGLCVRRQDLRRPLLAALWTPS
ncbi:HTH-type transcriptional activator IlvY [Pseudonocardia spinosispora]|uniref:HTH-type transcriptional activator IlvY n=1 Tax=Pseudonocardia spinosispora TaxID=103441 RepID=UPI0004012355|nr:HTH-type transcriptional activator IlvY [Pseudonocardia spinosispora]